MKSRLWRVPRIPAALFGPFSFASEQGLLSLHSSIGIIHTETPSPSQQLLLEDFGAQTSSFQLQDQSRAVPSLLGFCAPEPL